MLGNSPADEERFKAAHHFFRRLVERRQRGPVTPKRNVASFGQLALRYAPLRDQPAALAERAEKLRSGAIADHVNAHERLSAEDSARLVRWLADGAP